MIVHSADGVFGIRQWPWKLIEGKPTRPGPGGVIPDKALENKLQLYNVAEDHGEKNDVLVKHPDIVERLTKLLYQRRAEGHSRE